MAIIDGVQKHNSLKDKPGKSVIEKKDGKIKFKLNIPDEGYNDFLHLDITELQYKTEIDRLQAQLDLLHSFATEHKIKIS